MNYIKKILNNRIVKNSLTLINGTIIAQAINILMSPVLSRLYLPGDYGNYSSIVAIVAITSIIATLKFDLAIMDKENDKVKTKNTYYLAMISNLIISVIVMMLGIIISVLELNILDMTISKSIIIGIITFLSATNTIVNVWLNKYDAYKVIRNNRIIHSITYAVTLIVGGIFKLDYLGLIISLMASYIVQFVYVYAYLFGNTDFNNYKLNKTEIISQFKKYRKFPKYQMPALLLNSASTQLPIIMFTELISSTVSGWYAMTVKIINLPMTIVGQAMGDIYFKEASEIKSRDGMERLKQFTYNTYKKLLVLGIIPIGLLIGYGDILFKFVLGEEWYMAGIYAMILAPWYYVVFVTSPLTHIFVILDKQKNNLILNIMFLLSRIISIVLGIYLFAESSLHIIILFATIGFILWLLVTGYVLKLVGVKMRKSILISLSTLIIGATIISLPRIISYLIV